MSTQSIRVIGGGMAKRTEEQNIELWLADNTFECPAGRMSVKMCEDLRSRPTMAQIAHGIPLKNGIRKAPKRVEARPSVCMECTLWKEKAERRKARMQEELDSKRKVAKEDAAVRPQTQEEQSTQDKPLSMGLCKVCGKKFRPYPRGTVIVRRLCQVCMNIKLSSSGREVLKSKGSSLLIDFSKHIDLLDHIRESSKNELRSPEDQVLWLLIKATGSSF